MGSNVSTILKKKRKELGLSVKAVLDKLRLYGVEISDKTLYGWESGHRQPDADTFLVLCQIYGIDTLMGINKSPRVADAAPMIKLGVTGMGKSSFINARIQNPQYRMAAAWEKLNEAGQEKAVERVEELTEVPKYQRQVCPGNSDEELHAELDRQIAEEKKQADGQSASGHGSSEKATG